MSSSWIHEKNQICVDQSVNSSVDSCSAPKGTQKFIPLFAISGLLWRPLWLHSVDLLRPLNTEPLALPIT